MDKFLVDADEQCPAESEEVSWDYNFSMDYHMGMEPMSHTGGTGETGYDMDYTGPIGFDFGGYQL